MALNSNVALPVFNKLPGPDSTPVSTAVPEPTPNAAVPAKRRGRGETNPEPKRTVASLTETGPPEAPRLESAATTNEPPLTTKPPEKVLIPERTNVPEFDLTSGPPETETLETLPVTVRVLLPVTSNAPPAPPTMIARLFAPLLSSAKLEVARSTPVSSTVPPAATAPRAAFEDTLNTPAFT